MTQRRTMLASCFRAWVTCLGILLTAGICFLVLEAIAETDFCPFSESESNPISARIPIKGAVGWMPSGSGRNRANFARHGDQVAKSKTCGHAGAGTLFKSIRAWRRAGCPIPVQRISHTPQGQLKVGNVSAWGEE
jgi:hypothetical protein